MITGRLRTMQQSAPGFFGILRDVLVDNVVLSLAVLTDPATTQVKGASRDNLSIDRVIEAIGTEGTAPSDELDKIKAEAKSLRTAVSPIRLHRNRRIAHADADARLSPTDRLQEITVGDLRAAVKSTFVLLNRIQAIVQPGSCTSFDSPIITGCGESLIYLLRLGLEFRKLNLWLRKVEASGMTAEELRSHIQSMYHDVGTAS